MHVRGTGLIDRGFDWITRAIERTLALAFVFAVCLSFANVIGRYVLGISIIWADEAQIYIMVWMAFLGAVVVTWRQMHLRMDVLLQYLPERARAVLRIVELSTLLVLSGFVLLQSSRYVGQMMTLDRKSDTAGIPMWIPHSAVAVGFGLVALIALWRAIQMVRQKTSRIPAAPPAASTGTVGGVDDRNRGAP
ncbi:MAG: TRAP transporter small permease [Betaproteobacteria bacterium]|nr:TRAP transporter small permease [Betaproteobacteria bacterium]